jgi:hypothetical protein
MHAVSTRVIRVYVVFFVLSTIYTKHVKARADSTTRSVVMAPSARPIALEIAMQKLYVGSMRRIPWLPALLNVSLLLICNVICGY